MMRDPLIEELLRHREDLLMSTGTPRKRWFDTCRRGMGRRVQSPPESSSARVVSRAAEPEEEKAE